MSTTADLVTLRKVGGFTRVYAMGEVPQSPTYPYVVIGYSPNAPVVRDLGGSGDPVQRFTVQHFGKSDDSVEAMAAASFALFDGREVLGSVCWQEIATPLELDPDDRLVLSTTHTYRF